MHSDAGRSVMGLIHGQVKSATNNPKALDRMIEANLQYYTELATLNSMIGSGIDYMEQVDRMRDISRANMNRPGGLRAKAFDFVRSRLTEWGGGLSDFHRNYSELGKVYMWKAIREKFIDPETGDLATDKESLRAMQEEIRALDRSFGYSTDLEMMPMSRTARGISRMLLTAPTMYLSMARNLTTRKGLEHTGYIVTAGMMWFFAAAKSAGMDDDEILRRMIPGQRGFLTIEFDVGDSRMKLSLSNFYKSIAAMAGGVYNAAEKTVKGEPVTPGDFLAPVGMFARSRLSPFVSSLSSVLTGKDYLGRETSRLGAAIAGFTPISLQEPALVAFDRLLSRASGGRVGEGTEFALASAELHYSRSERDDPQTKAVQLFASVFGANMYSESEYQKISRRRNEISKKRLGIRFEDIPPSDINQAYHIAAEVQSELGSPIKFGGYDYLKASRRTRDEFLGLFPGKYRKYRRLIGQSGLADGDELNASIPNSVEVKVGDDKVRVTLSPQMKKLWWNEAIKDMVEKEGGLRDIERASTRNGVNPVHIKDDMKEVIKESLKETNAKVKAAAQIPIK